MSLAGVLAGPMAWAVDLQARYALVSYVCANHAGWMMWLISLAAFALALLGVFCSSRVQVRFMALSGMLISGMFALAIAAMAIPDLFLRACE